MVCCVFLQSVKVPQEEVAGLKNYLQQDLYLHLLLTEASSEIVWRGNQSEGR